MSRRTIIILFILVALITPTILIFSGVLKPKSQALTPVNLIWWTPQEDAASLGVLIQAYRASHPQVRISVLPVSPETYQQEMVNAWAKEQGPDIFTVPNTAVGSFRDFIKPMPKKTKVATVRTRKLLVREEPEVSLKEEAMLTGRNVRELFVDAVGKDVLVNDVVYGLPLAMDTLLLFANRDLLNVAGIVDPATTWSQFVEHVKRLTLLDSKGGVARPAAGIGLAQNVPHAFDLLSLLMMQNGALMTDSASKVVAFERANETGESPGLGALEFYTDFAQTNPPKETLTWSASQPSALDLFSQGKLAYAFGYQRDRSRLAQQNPGLNFTATAIPHILEGGLDNDATAPSGAQQRTITYGRYWVHTVSIKARARSNEAWNFLQFLAASDAVKAYLQSTNQISARRSVLKEQQANPDLAVQANQALAARSWYRGTSAAKAEEFFAKMIEDVALKSADPGPALSLTAQQIQQTLNR